MVDLFDEVEEQLRSERYTSVAKRLAPWISGVLALALVVALGYAGYQTWQTSKVDKASETYEKGLDALSSQDQTGAYTLFGEVAKDGPPGYRALALMQQAGIRLEAGKTAEAVALFDQAAKVAPTPVIADFAAMRSVYALIDDAPYAEMEKRLTPLVAEGRPYRLQAQEALAMSKLLAGKTAEAKSAFELLLLNIDAPQDMQQRAHLAIAAIDSGAAAALKTAAQTAATLPPPQMPSFLMPPGAAPPGAGEAGPEAPQ